VRVKKQGLIINLRVQKKESLSEKHGSNKSPSFCVALSLSRSFASFTHFVSLRAYKMRFSLFFFVSTLWRVFFFIFFWLGFRVLELFFFAHTFFSRCLWPEKRTHKRAETCRIISRFSLSHTRFGIKEKRERRQSCERRAILSSSTVVLVVLVVLPTLPLRALLFLLLLL
jgi:hypothetical protein